MEHGCGGVLGCYEDAGEEVGLAIWRVGVWDGLCMARERGMEDDGWLRTLGHSFSLSS